MEQKGLTVKRIDIGSTLDPVTVENAALAKANAVHQNSTPRSLGRA